ncbi:serine/threonine protein kinase with WD40 repeats [Microcystis aeruginosa NIES-3806]|uniref:Serine/threonine protein kinase with WD40 repeats n=3 Tax=Microcystis aeruginosa TaxID=1126 RepID=A0A6H9GB61_MICAE|nr:serine/threonine protein kinase with WD40 repeats [Microcystis aeruginosa NIES-3787]GCL56348.1 serine/threonine protein kinase with WD40 repeats [Microcystis aeruginosa NIES-3806]GCL56872.1 serine/threonine protein kinase with WD40 repeats [Microcystis aeruginosa NIES-3807]
MVYPLLLVLIRLNKLSDQMIKFWSLTSKEELGTLDRPTDKLLSLVISDDEKYLISGSADKTVKIWQNGQ